MNKIYQGSYLKTKNKKIRRAYIIHKNQCASCSNKNYKTYKDIGSKGIKVIYSIREFIRWFLDNYPNKKIDPSIFRVIRLDNNKDFDFNNIKIVSRREFYLSLSPDKEKKNIFIGELDKNSSPIVRKAYETWKNQRSRCNNKNNRSYKTYGAIGIKVMYSSREFVQWFIDKYPYKKIGYHDFCVGRINHDKDYTFSNLRFETRSESSKEKVQRLYYKK